MNSPHVRAALTALAITLALPAPPSHALAPIVAVLGKKLLQDMLTSTLKGMLFDSLGDLGCKGTALANGIRSLGSFKGAGAGAMSGMFAMPSLATMPNLRGALGVAGVPSVAGVPVVPGAAPVVGIAGMAGMPNLAGMPPEIAAMMSRMMPGGGLDAEQTELLAGLKDSMGTPLSPQETLATIDEMGELGLLAPAMASELKECLLVLPQAAQALGMGMGMMKSMLPQFREARDEMRRLSPVEQDELADVLAQELDQAPQADRKLMLAELRGGLFPPRVVDALSKRYGGR